MESEEPIVATKPKKLSKKVKKENASKSDLNSAANETQAIDDTLQPKIAIQPVIAIEPATNHSNDSEILVETLNLPTESDLNNDTIVNPIEPTIITDAYNNDFDDERDIIFDPNIKLQKLEEKARKAEEAFAAEEKLRKELEELNSKLLAEKTALLDSLSGEKGALSDYQEKCNKLAAQKADLDNQLRVSIFFFIYSNFMNVIQKKKK